MNHRLTLQQIARATTSAGGTALPLPAAGGNDASFDEPWQAHAFGLTLLLHARGVFTWPQWADALAQEIRRARDRGDTDDGTTYYHHWLQTLEQFVVQAGIGTPEQIHALEHAWEAAAARTPHGQAITLGAPDTERL